MTEFFRSEIREYKPLITPSDLYLQEDNEEAAEGGDDKDISIELFMLIMMRSR